MRYGNVFIIHVIIIQKILKIGFSSYCNETYSYCIVGTITLWQINIKAQTTSDVIRLFQGFYDHNYQ